MEYLNNELLYAPDLKNSFVRVLLRFRQDKIAIKTNVESMSLQIKVPDCHSNYMCRFWCQDGNLDSISKQYRFKSQAFRAVSSPSIANYALKRDDCEDIWTESPMFKTLKLLEANRVS